MEESMISTQTLVKITLIVVLIYVVYHACVVRVTNTITTKGSTFNEKGIFYICRHAYSYLDAFSIANQTEPKNFTNSVFITSIPDPFHWPLLHALPGVSVVQSFYGGTVKKSLELLNSGKNVFLFVRKEVMNSGAFHISRQWGFENTKLVYIHSPIREYLYDDANLIYKMISNFRYLYEGHNARFQIKLYSSPEDNSSQEYMRKVQKILYSEDLNF